MGMLGYVLGMPEHHRERKEELADEERRSKVADLYSQRNDIRDRLRNLHPTDPKYQEAMGALTGIQTNLDQIYHPVHAPGALQKDWQFLQGIITRRGKRKADTQLTPDVPAPAAGPDQTFTAAPETVTLAATPALTTPGTPDALAKSPEAAITLPAAQIKIPGTTPPKVVPAVQETMAAPPDKVKGLVAPGNLTIWDRPAVRNDDGTISSEYSTSFTDENPQSPYYGKEVLVPTVVGGKFLTPDGKKPPAGSDAENAMFEKAKDNYRTTGQHLGVFDNPKNADKYAAQLHSRGERGRPDAAAYQPKQTSYERKLQEQQDRAAKEAEQFAASLPASPEEESDAEVRKKVAGIKETMAALDDLMGPDWDQDEREEVRQSFIHTALGLDTKEKYFSNLQTTVDPNGKVHVYRVPQKAGAMPEEIVFPEGQQFMPKGGTDGTKGSDFYKALVTKYGPHPTSEQWEAERARWTALGAHGTSTTTVADAAGNLHSVRVPIFTTPPPQGVVTQLGIPSGEVGEAPAYSGGGAAGAGPSIAGAPGGGAAAGATGAAGAAGSATPAFAEPNPSDAAAAMAEANRLGIGPQVLGVANYQLAEGDVAATRGGQRGKFMGLVLRVNPGYQTGQYAAVQQTRKEFTAGGADAKAMQSLNTAVHHLQTLLDSANKLGNTEFPLANRAKNGLSIQLGHSEPTDFMAAGQAVADEVGRVFRAVGLTETETQGWKERLDYNMSPTQIRGAIKKMIELMAGRMQAEANTYKTTMGSMKGFPTLDPDVEDILRGKPLQGTGAQRILEINEEAKAMRAGTPAPAPAAPPAPQRGAAARPAGDKSIYVMDPNGNWFKAKQGTPIPKGYTVYAP